MTWKPRYTVLSVVLGAFLLCYMDRMVMASAIPFIARDFKLSSLTMGAVLSAFFAGYALMQLPGGLLADRFGPRRVLLGSIVWFSIMTALTGWVTGLVSILAVRILFGLGEGPFPSAAWKTVANWFPAQEAGRACGLLQASSYLGAAVAPLFVGPVILAWGWRPVFYILFAPGVLLVLLVWLFVKDAPAVGSNEAAGGNAQDEADATQSTPAKANLLRVLRNPVVLWCAACFFLANTVAWGLMNWLPTYLLEARGFGVEKMSVFTAITNLAGMVGFVLGGYLCDRYFSERLRVPIIAGLLTSAACTYLAAVAPTGEWAVAWLVLVYLTSNVAFTAIFTLPLLIVPKHAVGATFGAVNTAGQISGVLAPLLVGFILELTHNDFHMVLYCMVALALVAVYPASRIRPGQPAVQQYEGAV